MKSILFVIPNLTGGGAEKVLVNLANELSYKYSITILAIFDAGVNKIYLSQRVKYKYVFKWDFKRYTRLFKLFAPDFLCKLFIQGDYDYIISFLEYSCSRIVSGYKGQAKKIAWIHSTVNSNTLEEFLFPYRSRKECIECYNRYSKIVCVSQDVLDSFRREFPEVSTQCCVRYNILNSKNVVSLAKETVNDCVISALQFNICSIGRLIPIKGYMRLLKVCNRLIHEDIASNFHLYILGEGEEQSLLEKYISSNNLESYITLLGYRVNPYKYLSNMDLYVCSSFSEGLSTVVAESILLGIPALTTKCSGMNELLDNGNCGLIVENSEFGLYWGLRRIMEDRNLLLPYEEQIAARGKLFNDTYILKSIEELFAY